MVAPPPPAHENFVSIGHEADTRGSDKSPTRSVTDTQFGPEVMHLAGRPRGMTSVLIDFLKWVSREGAGGESCLVIEWRGQPTYPYPMWRHEARECGT